MSHNYDCPTEREARRDGERAGERGYGRNPYSDGCEEAERSWRSGYYHGQERREEEEMELRREEQRNRERQEYNYLQQREQSAPCEKCGELCDCISF